MNGEKRKISISNEKGLTLIGLILIILIIIVVVFIIKIATKKEDVGIASRSITSANYGDIIEYSANGVTDWKIFYDDGTNVYIIASDYLDVSKIPAKSELETQERYLVYWNSQNLITHSNLKSNFLFNDLSSINKSNENYKATTSLLDSAIWSDFVDETYADYAIGTPTLEMWVASWNEKGYTKVYTAVDSSGYYVGKSKSIVNDYVNTGNEKECSDTLYYPYQELVDNSSEDYCFGYWLAAPSSLDTNWLLVVDFNGYINSQEYTAPSLAVRPVVSLKSDVNLTKIDGIWTISE